MSDVSRCPHCGYDNKAGSRFCTNCGQSMTTPIVEAGPKAEAARWVRRPGEYAARLRSGELASGRGEIAVDAGTTAVIVQDGRVVEQQGPGSRSVGPGWWQRTFGSPQQSIVLLIDNGDVGLEYALADLYTLDPVALHATCRLVVRLKDAEAFYRTVMKDRLIVTVDDLRDFLAPDVREAALVFVAEQTADQIDRGLAERRELFGVEIGERLRPVFEASGLEFRRVQIFDVFHPRLDALRKAEEELFLGPAELHQKQRLFDLYDQQQLAEIAADETKAAHAERRSAVRRRIERLAQDDRIADIRSAQEFESFLAQVDRDKLLREDETAQLREAILAGAQDRQRQRARVLALAQLQDEFDLKQVQLERQFGQDQARLNNELELARRETLGRLEIEQQKVRGELEIQALRADQARAQRLRDQLDERERIADDHAQALRQQLAAATNQAEMARLRIEIERLEDQADLDTLERVQTLQRLNKEENLRIDRENEIKREQAALDAEERRHRMKLEERREEFERQKQIAALPLESQLSFMDLDKAGLVSKLLETRELKGMTRDQLEILMAAREPRLVELLKAQIEAAQRGEAGQADAEKWKTVAELVQRHQEEARRAHQEELERLERSAREAAERQERSGSKALDTLADIAKAFAQRPETPPTIVTPGGIVGGAGMVGGAGTAADAAVQVCPRCQVRMPVGTKFCGNCGHKFFES